MRAVSSQIVIGMPDGDRIEIAVWAGRTHAQQIIGMATGS
jgi:hypothetical protein